MRQAIEEQSQGFPAVRATLSVFHKESLTRVTWKGGSGAKSPMEPPVSPLGGEDSPPKFIVVARLSSSKKRFYRTPKGSIELSLVPEKVV